MKTCMIERVANGWLVRPFQACQEWASCDNPKVWVYQTIEEVQKDLPRLVETSDFNGKV